MLTHAFNLSTGDAHDHPSLHSEILFKAQKIEMFHYLKVYIYIYMLIYMLTYIYIYANKTKKEQSGDEDINLPNYPLTYY